MDKDLADALGEENRTLKLKESRPDLSRPLDLACPGRAESLLRELALPGIALARFRDRLSALDRMRESLAHELNEALAGLGILDPGVCDLSRAVERPVSP